MQTRIALRRCRRVYGFFNKSFSQELSLPVIEVGKFLNKSQGWEAECKLLSDCLHETGILAIRDPRVVENDNQVFIKQMEEYFYNTSKDYYKGVMSPDFHPEQHYQFGATPEFKEKARSHCEKFSTFPAEHRPVTECPPVYDSKWRFFWYIGERDPNHDKGMLVYENIEPKGYPQWKTIMNNWGKHMLNGTEVVGEMAAIGLGLEAHTFTERMKYAGHLLAPTGSDLARFDTNDIFAGVHYGKLNKLI